MAGFRSILSFLREDLESERAALRTYMEFAVSAADEAVRTMFLSLAKAEQGHANGLLKLLTDIEGSEHPVVFYCPVCGWEIDFGKNPATGKQVRCRMCGVIITLEENNDDYEAVIKT